MASTTFNTRISLKYDTLANWESKNPVLLAGEVALATVSTTETNPTQSTPPLVLMKVGDGTTAFNSLPYISARSQDVYAWAKAATKPSYEAKEITGIDTYIAAYVNDQMGISVDTDTQYTITKVNDYQYKLMSKSKADTEFTTEVAVIDIPAYDDSEVLAAIEALEGLVGTTSVADQIAAAIAELKLGETYELKGVAANLVQELADGAVAANTAAINAIKDGTTIDSFADVEAQFATAQEATEAVQAQVTTLVGSDANKSVREIANEELAAQLVADDAKDSLNTLEEIAAWIQSHPDDASAMNAAITALQNKVDTGDKTVSAYVADAITALSIGDYAKAADLTSLAARVEALEGKVATWDAAEGNAKAYADELNTAMDERVDALEADTHTHENKDVIDGITAEKVAAWDAAEGNAKDYTDEEIGKLAAVASSGDIADLTQAGDYVVFNCGTASTVI